MQLGARAPWPVRAPSAASTPQHAPCVPCPCIPCRPTPPTHTRHGARPQGSALLVTGTLGLAHPVTRGTMKKAVAAAKEGGSKVGRAH